VVKAGASRYDQEIAVGPHRLLADEPRDVGGNDAGPNPYELLLAALGACTSMTVRMYAERKQWPLQGVEMRLAHSRIHAEDCAECDTKQGMLDSIEAEITLIGELSDEQRQRLVEIASMCPVHRTLKSEIQIRTDLSLPALRATSPRESPS
jgi:putative redox protein